MIVCVAGRQDAVGSIDYYVTFRDENDNWSEPVNLGEKINTKGFLEFSPYVSPDGKYFFFMSSRMKDANDLFGTEVVYEKIKNTANKPENGNPDIYWVDAKLIEKLKIKK